MPEISVIVPVYKVEQYLHQCVDSILAQTFTDFELILVDDGSPDGCPAICDDYAEKDDRVRVIHQKNQGQSAARNHAIREAKGKWVHFVDSDDLIHPQMLEILLCVANEQAVPIVMCDKEEGTDTSEYFFNTIEKNVWNKNCDVDLIENYFHRGDACSGVVWAKLIDKTIVEKYPFAEGRIYEDNALVCEWLCESNSVARIKIPLYFYRINPTGTTKSGFSEKQLDQLWAFEQQIACYRKYGYTKMLNIICDAYMWTAYDFYLKSINELKRKDVARAIAKKTMQIYKQNKDGITLSSDQLDCIFGTLFPRRMAIRWKWKAISNRIKRLFGKKHS